MKKHDHIWKQHSYGYYWVIDDALVSVHQNSFVLTGAFVKHATINVVQMFYELFNAF